MSSCHQHLWRCSFSNALVCSCCSGISYSLESLSQCLDLVYSCTRWNTACSQHMCWPLESPCWSLLSDLVSFLFHSWHLLAEAWSTSRSSNCKVYRGQAISNYIGQPPLGGKRTLSQVSLYHTAPSKCADSPGLYFYLQEGNAKLHSEVLHTIYSWGVECFLRVSAFPGDPKTSDSKPKQQARS